MPHAMRMLLNTLINGPLAQQYPKGTSRHKRRPYESLCLAAKA